MKRFIQFLASTIVLGLLLFFQACTNTDDEPGPGTGGGDEELSLANLVGRWGITQSTVDGGTPQTLVPCENTIQLDADGGFLVVNADEGVWREGNASFSPTDSILTIRSGGSEFTLKLLSWTEDTVEFRGEDNTGGGTAVFSTDRFVKLEDGDCPSITSAELQSKWSIDQMERTAYDIEEGERGAMLGTELIEDIPYNKFTIEFKSDMSFVMIDLVNEFDYGLGTYRNLDDHNFIIEFDDDDGDDEEILLHLKINSDNGLSFMFVEEDEINSGEEVIIVTELDLVENDGSEPLVTAEQLEGKWSAGMFAERALLDGQVVAEHVEDQIPHNKLTLEFFDDNGALLIDLVDEIGFDRGEYMLLDGSNILLDIRGDEDDNEEEDNFELFHVMSVDGDAMTLKSFSRSDHDGDSGDGDGGIANDGHGDGDGGFDYDTREFELLMNKNSGSEPGIMSEELIGMWQVTDVEDLSQQGQAGEGPQIGMVLNFAENGTGVVTFEEQEVATFSHEYLDMSNLLMIFDDNEGDGDGGTANDGHEEEEDNYNIFHIVSVSGNTVELILYEPDREDHGDGDGSGDGTGGTANDGHGEGDEGEEESGGPTYRIVIQKQ